MYAKKCVCVGGGGGGGGGGVEREGNENLGVKTGGLLEAGKERVGMLSCNILFKLEQEVHVLYILLTCKTRFLF